MYSFHEAEEPLKKPRDNITPSRIDPESRSPIKPRYECCRCHKGCRDYFEEYCNNTSLHGLKYVGGERRTLVEKLLWLALFITAVTLCTKMIIKTYQKWENTPVIVSFAENPTPVWQIPFPAVTICPITKVKREYHNYTDLFHKFRKGEIEEDDRLTFEVLSLVCDMIHVFPTGDSENVTKLEWASENLSSEEVLWYLKSVAPNITDVMDTCFWDHKMVECDTLFRPILNEDGLCFTFNMLHQHDLFTDSVTEDLFMEENITSRTDWTAESQYPKGETWNVYPKRIMTNLVKAGLDVVLRSDDSDMDYICKNPVQGYKLILHEPGNLSRGKTHFIRISIDQEVTVAIEPKMMTTSEGLRSYDPSHRKCYFEHEKNLQFFKRYTPSNCEMECYTNYTLEECGCVSFYMPHVEGTDICGPKNFSCTTKINQGLRSLLYNRDKGGTEYQLPCNCLSSCFSLSYNAETSQAVFEWEKFFDALGRPPVEDKNENLTGIHLSRVRLFYKDTQFISTQRNELYGVTDFIANCGGIFGLFTGFSLLSLMEILYYCSGRIWINKLKYGRCCMATPENYPDEAD